jgi:CubicO group peptidase (beta-lactamase class C family)
VSVEIGKTICVIQDGLDRGLHSGAQIYLSLNGETLVNQGVGEARPGTPLTPETIMLWMSSCKPLTTIAIAQLLERNVLKLDDLVTNIIPDFGERRKDVVTIRQLLNHTGGFRSADLKLRWQSWDEAIELICQAALEPRWLPGERAGYHSASSWYILGEIVRRLDGRTVDTYIKEEIFKPLGIEDAWLGLPESVQEKYADRLGHMHYTSAKKHEDADVFNSPQGQALVRPGGNGRGPASALGLIYENLLGFNKIPILQPETIRTFTTRSRVDMFDETFKHVMDWGLGFMPDNKKYGPAVPYGYGKHCSNETFGHSGSQSSTAFADPEYGLAAVVMFNGMPGELRHQRRIKKTCEAIYQDLELT